MNYSRIIRNIIGEGARSNKFIVRFNDLGYFARDLNFICVSSKIPSMSAKTSEFHYKGHSVSVPISADCSTEWNADFYLDEKHQIKKFFDDWIESFDTRGENISKTGKAFSMARTPRGSTLTNFTCTVDVEQYPFDVELYLENKRPTAIYRLFNVFPTSVGEISLDENDSIEKLSVNFKLSYFERIL